MKPAKCPFYPDSCTVEFHPNMQHVWRDSSAPTRAVAKLLGVETVLVNVITNTKSDAITNKKADRARTWNKANRETYNARQKKIMAGRRAKRGS